MSDNLFRKYQIPIITSNLLIKSASNDGLSSSQEQINQITKPGEISSIELQTNSEFLMESSSSPIDNKQKYQHPSRFIAPGRQGTNFTPAKRAPKRMSGGSIKGYNSQKSRTIFGRDESYPEELNSLIKPLFCELCNAQLNSPKTANIHYQSKTHDKNIKVWLDQNYTKKGLEAPKIKRFYRGGSGPVGPDAYHCECCDLKLNSKLHAEQHYMGRKHNSVLNNMSNPSGSGYYTGDGKWVRMGLNAASVGSNDGRFGIGEGFKNECLAAEATNDITDDTESVSIEKDLPNQEDPKIETSESLACKLCNISVTSSLQMSMHLEGTKHRKKVESCGPEQHNMERKHNLMLNNMSKPSGSGNYTGDEKGVRMGSKSSSVGSNDVRFGIGEGLKNEYVAAEVTKDITDDTESVSTEKDLPNQENPKIETSESLTCKLCNISVTSSLHMSMHLEGTKHRKKLKTSGDQTVDVSVVKSNDTVLASLNKTEIYTFDMSMYRTPSGSFYCKTCDISLIHQSGLLQHLQGKKHIKKSAASSKDQTVAN